jgi:hypothetical protein
MEGVAIAATANPTTAASTPRRPMGNPAGRTVSAPQQGQAS